VTRVEMRSTNRKLKMAWKDGLGLQHLDGGIDGAASAVAQSAGADQGDQTGRDLPPHDRSRETCSTTRSPRTSRNSTGTRRSTSSAACTTSPPARSHSS